MKERILINLKSDAYANFILAYTGARTIINNITKTTIMSNIIQNAKYGNTVILNDSSFKPYTFNELSDIGITYVRNILNDVLKKESNEFLKEIGSLEIGTIIKTYDEEMYKDLAFKLIKKKNYINLKDVDIDNIMKVILISNDDLQADNIDNDEEAEIDNIKKTYHFIKLSKPYVCYNELKKISEKYKSLIIQKKFYNVIAELLIKLKEQICKECIYKEIIVEKHNEQYEDSIDFLREFKIKLHGIHFNEFLNEEQQEIIYSYYLNTSLEEIEKNISKCNVKCDICAFNNKKCCNLWAEDEVFKMLLSAMFIKCSEEAREQQFRKECFEEKANFKLDKYIRFVKEEIIK